MAHATIQTNQHRVINTGICLGRTLAARPDGRSPSTKVDRGCRQPRWQVTFTPAANDFMTRAGTLTLVKGDGDVWCDPQPPASVALSGTARSASFQLNGSTTRKFSTGGNTDGLVICPSGFTPNALPSVTPAASFQDISFTNNGVDAMDDGYVRWVPVSTRTLRPSRHVGRGAPGDGLTATASAHGNDPGTPAMPAVAQSQLLGARLTYDPDLPGSAEPISLATASARW